MAAGERGRAPGGHGILRGGGPGWPGVFTGQTSPAGTEAHAFTGYHHTSGERASAAGSTGSGEWCPLCCPPWELGMVSPMLPPGPWGRQCPFKMRKTVLRIQSSISQSADTGHALGSAHGQGSETMDSETGAGALGNRHHARSRDQRARRGSEVHTPHLRQPLPRPDRKAPSATYTASARKPEAGRSPGPQDRAGPAWPAQP